MKQYLELCDYILQNGIEKPDRTGTGTKSIFGYQMRFDLQKGFPLLTTKDMGGVRLNGIIEELLWFLSGETSAYPLVKKGVNIWNRDAYRHYKSRVKTTETFEEYMAYIKLPKEKRKGLGYEYGEAIRTEMMDLGPVYGFQWRRWPRYELKGELLFDGDDFHIRHNGHIDQIRNVVEEIRTNPHSRRHIVSAWNVSALEEMALPPCHVLFQFYVRGDYLDCHLYQRSGDVFLGVPYNIASYSLLTMMIAQVTGLKPGHFIHTLGDAHIYKNHMEQVKIQLAREPKSLPTMKINPNVKDIDEFTREDFTLEGYDPHPSLRGEQSF